MESFLDTLEDEEPQKAELDLPDQDSSFMDTLDDEGAEETPLPVEDQRPKISSYEPTVFDKMRNIFRDPAKEAAKASIAMVDSKMLGISPSQAMRLRGPIDRGVKIDPAAAGLRQTLTKRLGSKLDKGYAQVNSGLWNYDLLTGNESQEVVDGVKKTGEFLAQPEAIPESMLEDAVGSAAEMFPFLAESAQRGGWRGVIMAGGTMLMGTVAGVPEITYPLAAPMYAIGQTSASLEFVSKVEAGLAYSELRNFKDPKTGEQIDPNIAKAAAHGVGAINGLLELAQLKTLIKTIPGGKKLLSGIVLDTVKEAIENKSLHDIAGKYATQYGKMIATETLQETAQESTNVLADIFSKKLTNELKGTDISMPEAESIVNRLSETIKQSAKAFAVMGLPGNVLSAGMEAKKGEAPGTTEGEAPGQPRKEVQIDTRTKEEKAVDQIINTSFDRVTSVGEKDLDVEIANIMAEIEKDEVPAESTGMGEKTQAWYDQSLKIVPKEEADMTMAILGARAKSVGMDLEEYMEYEGLSLEVPGEQDGLPGDLAQTKEQTKTPEFKAFFGESKVVDEAGEPLVVYHATDQEFKSFDPNKKAGGQLGKGFYFTPKTKDANLFAKVRQMKDPNAAVRVLPVYLSLKNPYIFEDYGDIPLTGIATERLQGQGYDGVIVKRNGDMMDGEITVFDPTQIKSIFNEGTFDPKNPNILKQEQTGPTEEIKASVTFTDTKTIIRAFQSADVSSLVHELGHVFRRDIGGEDLVTVEAWAGVKEGKWTVPAEEKFARGWENYLATGQAPTAELQSVFEKFKVWLSEIYNSIKGSSIDVNITPEVRDVFDRLLIPADGVDGIAQKTGVTELQQSAEVEPKNLFVAHNLSSENILAAADLGGLAAPSIAVARSDISDFTAFGEVTLLADPSLLEGKKIRTFDADVYSPRQPRATYDINQKYFREFEKMVNSSLSDLDLNIPDIQTLEGSNGADELLRSVGAQYHWLKSQDKAPKTKKRKVDTEVRQASKFEGNRTTLALNGKVQDLAKKYYTKKLEIAKEKSPKREKIYYDLWFDEDGNVSKNAKSDFISSATRFRDSKGVDVSELKADIAKKMRIKKNKSEYEQWVTETFNGMVDKKTLFKGFTNSGNKKYVPYNMENVVKDMTQKLQGGEGHFYGAGSVRSAYANEMKTIKDVQKRRDQIVTSEEMDTIKNEANDVLVTALTELKPFYKFDADSWGYSDDAGIAIAEGRKGQAETFEINDESKKIIDDLVEYLTVLPSSYFEAKAQRAVKFSEFDTAVVPKGMRKDALKVLKEAGLKIKTYDPKEKTSRSEVIAKQNNILFQSAETSQTPIEILEENFTRDYIPQYSPGIMAEYEAALKKAVMLAEYNLEKIHEKEDQISLRNIKKEAEDIANSSGVFADWKAAIDEGGLNLESARSLSDKETVNTLMKRRPGLFKKGASFHAETLSDRLGFDKPDDMFQAWLTAGSKKDAVNSIMNDMIQEYEYASEIGRNLTVEEDLAGLEAEALGKILLKRKPVDRKIKGTIRKVTGQVRDDEKTITDREALRESLKRSAIAARKAMSIGDKEGVAKERARYQEIIKNATTRRKRSATIKTIKANIKKELRTAKVKKHTGKFTPEIQDTLDTLIRVSKLSKDEAENKLVDNLEKYLDKDIPQEVVIENHMLEMVARLDTMDSIGGLESLLAEIKALKDEGRMINQLKKFNRESRDIARKEITVEELGGVPDSIKFTGIKDLAPKKAMDLAKQALKSHGKTIMGWDDLMDILSGKTKSKPGESFISKDNDLLGFKNAEKKGTRIAIDRMNADYKKAYGLKSNRQATKRMYEDNHDEIKLKKVSFTDPIDGTAVEMDLVFTRSELRERAMKLMDPTLEDSFKEMGYNESTKADISEALTSQDKEFIENQLDFYREYYDGVNEVYKEYNGINLPKNKMYSPLRREGIAKPVDDGMGEFLKETSFRASAANPGASKARTANTLTISKISDLSLMERHVSEMEHFKAWAEKIRDMNAVWKDPKVRQAVEINHGEKMLGLIDNFVGDIANGASRMGQRLEGLDKFRSNIVKSMLALKPAIMLKQLTSFVAFADKMPSGQFAKYMVQFWANPVKNTRDLYSSEMLKARGKNIERDLKLAMQSKEHSAFAKHQSFFDMMMLNVQMGDQGAIVLGGWPYYKYLMDKKGLTHDQAIFKMEKAAESSQQSGDITEQSAWQRGGSLAKLLTMFQSSQNQYIRKEIGAVRNLFNGRQGIGQTMKTLLIFHVMLPMLFQFASDRFTWDEDEQKRAALFGSLNGYFIVGDALDYIIRYMLGMQNFNMEMPVYSAVHDFIKMTALVGLFDLSIDEAFKAFESLGGVLGVGTGLPLKQATRTVKGAVDVLDSEYEKGFSELMGYSPYLSEKLARD